MSYDLYFTEPEITLKAFENYFTNRLNYNFNGSQAWYENPDTGVYFVFEYSNGLEEDPEAPRGNVTFNLNYFRPHTFALEAEPEVKAFINHFGCRVFDPQVDGMEEGTYDSEGFVRGWNKGNMAGYHAYMHMPENHAQIHTRPSAELEAIWKWNYQRKDAQSRLKEDIFVPSIMYGRIDERLVTMAVWPDAIPTVIPQVDMLVIPRKKFAPRRIFSSTVEDMCVKPIDKEVHDLLGTYKTKEYCLPAWTLNYDSPNRKFRNFIKNLKPYTDKLVAINSDEVLNAELVAEALKK